jgi:hypothetical protein
VTTSDGSLSRVRGRPKIDPGQCPVTCTKVSVVPQNPAPLPDFTRWPSFPFEGDLRVKKLNPPVATEPPRSGEDAADCIACNTPDDAYIWVSERWRVRAMDRPTGLPMVLILECRSHLDLGDLPNLLAAELGVMTVRLERAIRSLDGVARVHVNRWGDGSAHLHMWFLARPYGQLQLRGTFLSLWDDILPRIPEQQWRENLALVAAWLAEFGGRAIAEPPHIQWQSPGTFAEPASASAGQGAASAGEGAAVDSGSTESSGVPAPRRAGDFTDRDRASADEGAGVPADEAGTRAEEWGAGTDAGPSEPEAGTGTNRGEAAEGTGEGAPRSAGDGASDNGATDAGGIGHRGGASDEGTADRAARVPRQADGSAVGSRAGDHGAAVVD